MPEVPCTNVFAINELPRCVFVYGTLRRGSVRDITRLQPAPRFLGRARVQGRLFHLGAYPGLLLGGPDSDTGWVRGEVYAIEPALEQLLDQIEDVWPIPTGEYAKREVSVQLLSDDSEAAPTALSCLLYEIHPDRVIGQPLLKTGDWMAL